MAVNEPGRLPCGRDPLELEMRVLASGVVDPLADDEHVQSCPWCREVVDAVVLQQLAVAELRTETVAAPANLAGEVMRGVWQELRVGRWIALPSTEGPASASDLAISQTLRRLVDDVPDVEVSELRLIDPRDLAVAADRAVVEPDPRAAPTGPGVRLEISVRLGRQLGEVAGGVREVVRSGMLLHCGLDCPTVDIVVTDLLDEVPAGPAIGGVR